jgi:2-methylisocitrate lyase-like PEP mutase family enzyme
MTSMPSSAPSASKPHDTGPKREQNPHLGHCNGLKQIGDPESRFAETVRRAEAYLAAGADCIFPFAVTDADTIGRLTQAIQAPINIVGRAGTPDVSVLERLGVKRVSTASGLAMMAIEEIQRVSRELRKRGSFDILNYKLKRTDIQNLFEAAER